MRNFFDDIPRFDGEWTRHARWWTRETASVCELVPVIAGGTTAAFTQTHGRFRNDDGSETTATWKANEDTNVAIPADTTFRIRLQVDETAGGTSANFVGVLRYSHNGGAYTAVTGSSTVVKAVASANVTDEGATTNQLTAPTGTFLTGAIDEVDGSAGTTQVDFAAGQFTEFEYVVQIVGTDVAVGDTIDFRCYRATNALNTYTVSPRAIVANVKAPAQGGLSLAGTVTALAFVMGMSAGSLAFAGAAPTVAIGSGTTIEVPAGSLTIAGTTPTILNGPLIEIPAGSLVFKGPQEPVTFTVTPDPASLSLTGLAPTISHTLSIAAASLVLTGQDLVANTGITIAIGSGSLVFKGPAAPGSPTLSPDVAALALTGYAPTLSWTIPIDPAALTLTGQTPERVLSGSVPIPVGSLELTGTYVAVGFDGLDTADLTLTGHAPSVAAGGGNTTYSPAQAELTLTGHAPALALTLPVASGTLTLTGTVSGQAWTVPIGVASLSLQGAAPSLLGAGAISPDAGALQFTGHAPTAAVAFTLAIGQGTLTLTGEAPQVSSGSRALPDAGALVIAGLSPTVKTDFVLSIGSGVLTLTGLAPDAGFGVQNIAIDAGALALNGLAPSLIQTRVGVIDVVGSYVGNLTVVGAYITTIDVLGEFE